MLELEAEVGQRRSKPVQQTDRVVGVYLDDRVGGRLAGIGDHGERAGGRRVRTLVVAAAGRDALVDVELAGQGST